MCYLLDFVCYIAARISMVGTWVRLSLGADNTLKAGFPLAEPLPDRCAPLSPAAATAVALAEALGVSAARKPSPPLPLLPAAAALLPDGRAASAA